LKNRPLDPRKTLIEVFGNPKPFFQKGFWPPGARVNSIRLDFLYDLSYKLVYRNCGQILKNHINTVRRKNDK
jgi:hypothetical protein